jgi:hypothetical protein
MRHICDVCVSCADVLVVFLTYMCILTQHMRSLSDIEDVGTNVFIIISTHALVSQTVCGVFLTYTHFCRQYYVMIICIHHILHASVFLILRKHHFIDACAYIADGYVFLS